MDVDLPQSLCLGPTLLLSINLPYVSQNLVFSMNGDGTFLFSPVFVTTCLCFQSSHIDILSEAINNDIMQLDNLPKGN